MFSQKKRNYRWILHLCIIIFAAVLVFWILSWAGGLNDPDRPVVKPENVENTVKEEPDKKDEQTEFYSSYYLVKYDNHVIKIFFSDETGKMTELEDTSIVYETLASADQNDFLQGVRVNSRDELNKLLMDYES